MKLTVRHVLTLPLGAPVRSVMHLLLTPSTTPQQRVERWSIEMPGIEGAAAFRDGFGNRAHLVTQVKAGDEVTITVTGNIETFNKAGVLGRLDYDPTNALFRRVTGGPKPDAAVLQGLSLEAGRIGQLHELMGRVHDGRPAQTQAQDGQGQSQGADQAGATDVFIGAARALLIPARFVRGYLLDDGVASLHDWAEAWDDGLGWIGFDPRLNVCPTTGHIRIACGLNAAGTPLVRSVPAFAGEFAESLEISDHVPST